MANLRVAWVWECVCARECERSQCGLSGLEEDVGFGEIARVIGFDGCSSPRVEGFYCEEGHLFGESGVCEEEVRANQMLGR
jgi:hypothetical protein